MLQARNFLETISEHHVEIGLVAGPSLQGTLIGIHCQACFCLNHGPLLLTLFNMWHMIFASGGTLMENSAFLWKIVQI